MGARRWEQASPRAGWCSDATHLTANERPSVTLEVRPRPLNGLNRHTGRSPWSMTTKAMIDDLIADGGGSAIPGTTESIGHEGETKEMIIGVGMTQFYNV